MAAAIPRRQMRQLARRFHEATTDCRSTQQGVLERLIALNGDSRFAREHRLDEVRDGHELRRRLPVADYELFRPYIEQLKLGDHRALLGSNNPLLMFMLSSGTTSDSKFIPITQQFLDDYRRGWKIWGIRAYDDHPRANSQNIIQFVSNHERFFTEGGTPCGNVSGLVVAMKWRAVRKMYSIPSEVVRIADADAKYYAALRFALADDNVGMVTTANPSTLLQVAKFTERHRENLIRDIADGTLDSGFEISAEVRRSLHPLVTRRNPRRARQLEAIVESTGQLRPADFWPEMQILAVWTAGSCSAYLPLLKQYFGDVAIRDHGLSASEGRMTIPLEDNSPDGVLDVTTHYFEFIPADEYGTDNPTVLEAHELVRDEDYFILLTTSSGLYRYDISDVVRCTGFEGTTPLLRFLHKGAHIANITGEKLSESQIVDSVRSSADRLSLALHQFTAMPVWGEPPWYQLAVEQGDLPSPESGLRLAEHVDERLQEVNCEYREKRLSGRLAALRCLPLPPGTWEEFARQRQQQTGGSVEQYKHPCLIPDLETSSAFLRDYAPDTGLTGQAT